MSDKDIYRKVTNVNMELKDRIATIIQVNQHTASSFADHLGVPRSRISHIMNGRNKPSIDFIELILEKFPRVDASWLITGKEPSRKDAAPTLPEVQNVDEAKKQTTFSDREASVKRSQPESFGKQIDKIVVFYTDHTFETYNQSTHDH